MNAIVAVELLSQTWGVGFGRALERLLSESETFERVRNAMECNISQIDIEKTIAKIKKTKKIRIYLPRSTMDMNAIVAVELLSQTWGVGFGRALERLLSESETFERVRNAVECNILQIDIEKTIVKK